VILRIRRCQNVRRFPSAFSHDICSSAIRIHKNTKKVKQEKESQELFEDQDIENQHFSQEQSHNETMLLTRQAVDFLLQSSFNLKVERRFKLDRPRAPVEIAIIEYGGPGENDANIDLFIESNKLKGNQILLLPALTEVLVYG